MDIKYIFTIFISTFGDVRCVESPPSLRYNLQMREKLISPKETFTQTLNGSINLNDFGVP